MGIIPQWTAKDVEIMLSQHENRIKEKLYNALLFAGESGIEYARKNGSYIDRTGNLRSSVGYIITYNGAIAKESGFGSKSEGASQGQQLAETLAMKTRNTGFCLVMVAGMNYSLYVEMKGRDVLTGGSNKAEKAFKTLIDKTFKK